MPRIEFPIVGQPYSLYAKQVDYQNCINWYVSGDPTGKFRTYLQMRPSLKKWSDGSNEKHSRGSFTLNNKLYVVNDNKFYFVDKNGNKKELGTLKSSCGHVKIIANESQLFITDKYNGYVYQYIDNDEHDAGDFFVVDETSSFIGDPLFNGSGLNDMNTNGIYTGNTNKTYRVEIDSNNNVIGKPVFTGDGLNDMTNGGVYVGLDDRTYKIVIDSVSETQDTFKWSDDGGQTYRFENVNITEDKQDLDDGIIIQFSSKSGHTKNDFWTFDVVIDSKDTFKWSENGGQTFVENKVVITGDNQELNDGVLVKFNHLAGHTVNDYWDFDVTIDKNLYVPIIPAYQDGYGIYVRQVSGRFYISSIGDFSKVNALDYASATVLPDYLVAAISIREEVYLFGNQTIEVWYNVGNETFPFLRREGLVFSYGLSAPYSLTSGGNNILFFLATNTDGDHHIARISNYEIVLLSDSKINQAVGEEINSYDKFDDAFGWCENINGHLQYLITFPSADRTWVYDNDTGLFHERRSTLSSNNPAVFQVYQGRFRANWHSYCYNKHLVGDFESGNIYEYSNNESTDDGDMIVCERTSQHITNLLADTSFEAFEIDFEKAVANVYGEGSDPQVMMYVSRDGVDFKAPRKRSFGKVGEYDKKIQWRNLGSGRQITIKIRVTDSVYKCVIGSVLEYEVDEDE